MAFKFDFKKYNELLGRGLCSGAMNKNQVCIEMACAIALGEAKDPKDYKEGRFGELVHRETGEALNGSVENDDPTCVHSDVRQVKISLNDNKGWKSPSSRAKGLRTLGVAQLGTRGKGTFKPVVFNNTLEELFRKRVLHYVLTANGINKVAVDVFKSGRKLTAFEEFLLRDRDNDDFFLYEDDITTAFEMRLPEKALLVMADCIVEALRKAKSPGIKLLKRLR